MAYYNDRGLSIGDLTIGMSSAGVAEYKAKLKADLLDTVEKQINNIDNLTKAFDSGWQGLARDNFDKKFEAERQRIIEDLKAEYANIEARINDLELDYLNQDKNMIV